MSNIKNYDIGSIRLDAPKKHFIYELPLLSFGDTRGAVGLSLVFNSSLADVNDYYMSKGHKLNLQKSLLLRSDVPGIYEDGDGTRVNLIEKGNCYLFDDDSQRIIRGTSSGYVLENPDYSTETYTTLGHITSVADKYGETYLTYTYESGKLASIKYRTNKFINLSYNNLGTLGSIEYVSGGNSVCTISLGYNGSAHSIVTHYSGVRYYTAYSGGVFTAYSTDIGSTYSEAFYHKVICTKGTDTITFVKYIGSETVDSTTYKFTDYSPVDGEYYSQIEVTDFYGVKSRTQYKGDRALCTYEIGDADVEFTGNKHLGNVQIHRHFISNSGKSIGEKQSIEDCFYLEATDTASEQKWEVSISNFDDNKGMYVLSGWVRVLANYEGETLPITVKYDVNSTYTYDLPKPPVNQWEYFSVIFPLYIEDFCAYILDRGDEDTFETNDFRLTFKPLCTSPYDDTVYFSPSDSLLVYHGNSTPVYIPLGEATFKCGDVNLSDGGPIYYEDLLKYKINKWKNVNTTEFYCDCVRNLLTIDSSEDVTLTYEDNTYNLSDCYLGQYQHTTSGAIITQIIDDSISYLTIRATDSDGNLISSQNINSNLDVISSTVNGVTTYYERTIHTATNALFTKERIPNLYCTETWYTDNAVTVYNVNESDNSNISYVTYNIDPVWGAVTSVVDSEGAKITDTHDDDKCALLSRKFNDNPSITNLFTYESGNLSTLANGSLKYKMSYTNGRLSGISKLNATTTDTWNSIESHSYEKDEADGTVKIVSSYPSATSPLKTVTQYYDKYGRLTSITGIITNTYDADPHCTYGNGVRYNGSTSDEYTPDGDEELSYETAGCNNASAMLATSKDLLTGETTKYAYSNGRISHIGVFNSSNSKINEGGFIYDKKGRMEREFFTYDIANSKTVKRNIGYLKNENDPAADNRANGNVFRLDNELKAIISYSYDDYKRPSTRTIKYSTGVTDLFTKSFEYDKTRISTVRDSINNSVTEADGFAYDNHGRITAHNCTSLSGSYGKTYVYDDFGQLIRENNKALDKTYIYSYNGIGNITSVKAYAYTTAQTPSGLCTTTSLTYGSTVPDRLTKFGYNNISYDSMGYPTAVGNKKYVWNKGKLTRIYDDVDENESVSSEDIRFTYNACGQRISKSYSYDPGEDYSGDYMTASTTTYTYDGRGRLIREYCTESYYESDDKTRELIYLYDEMGIVGVLYSLNGAALTTYYYRRNPQGDVTAIYTTTGTRIGEYAYDAFGNCTILYGSSNDLVKNNPILYRGYYYDKETNLYYLNARYYNPQWRRFISPDSTSYLDPESVNGLNLYCYCYNDPVNYVDPSGNAGISLTVVGLIIGAVIGATIGGVAAYSIAQNNGAEGWELFGWTTLGIVGGGVIGGALGYGAGALVTKATGILGFSVFNGYIFTVTQTVVIGHYGYTDIAKSLGYGFYEIDDVLYKSLSHAQRWAMNSQFLADCSKLGANFLVEPTRVISPTFNGNISYLYYEIQYLLEHGYVWLEDLSALVKQ